MITAYLDWYTVLKPLQGIYIPMILFSGKADNFIVIGMSLVEGHHVEPISAQPQLSEILQLLSGYGVVQFPVQNLSISTSV